MDRLSGISEDITESRELEDRLRQAQKMEAVGRLAGGIAHDFNNLLTVILGYSSVLLQGTAPDTHARWYVTQIQAAGERCASLTNQLLAFSRKQVQHPVPLDLHHIIRHLVSMLESLIGEHIRIVLQLDPKPRWAKADATQLEQVFINLALNGMEAMANTLPGERRLRIRTRSDGSRVELSVSDFGRGIAEHERGSLFQPFFTTKAHGVGLGLSICRSIAEAHGGHIAAENGSGRGAEFILSLPVHAPGGRAEEKRVGWRA